MLSGLDVLPIKLVALLHRAETCVLSDGPRTVGIHSWVWATGVRILPWYFSLLTEKTKQKNPSTCNSTSLKYTLSIALVS